MYPTTNQGDKIKAYYDTSSTNFTQPTNYLLNNNNIKNSHNQTHFVTSTYSSSNPLSNNFSAKSDKYKDYYNEFQDYRSSSYSQLSTFTPIQSTTQTNEGFFQTNRFASTTPNIIEKTYDKNRDSSVQRKRFFTVLNDNDNEMNTFTHKKSSNFNSNMNLEKSFISINDFSPKKDLYKFVKDKFAANRNDRNENNHIQSYEQINNHDDNDNDNDDKETYMSQIISGKNKSQFLDKANKKISLKRDIISPRGLLSSNFEGQLENRFRSTSFFQPVNQNKQQKQVNPASCQTILPSTKNTDVNHENNFFKKKESVLLYETSDKLSVTENNPKISSYQLISEQVNSPKNPSLPNQKGKNVGIIRNNRIITNSQPHIDNEIYTDMKISKIQETTLTLQTKIDSLTQQMQLLFQHSQDQQNNLNMLNGSISQLKVSGLSESNQGEISPSYMQDIKRIKKQIKIMKTNFQTAFTSMTQQINRKLVKQETIMKRLSDEIKSINQQNKQNTQTQYQIRIDSESKINSLQTNMLKYIKQNEQRMQSLTLNNMNDSFSSKRSKNSFQYGIDLRSMSGEESLLTSRENAKEFNEKLKEIQREIKKMKVFHIQQQEVYKERLRNFEDQIQLNDVKLNQQMLMVKMNSVSLEDVDSKIRNVLDYQLKNSIGSFMEEFYVTKNKQIISIVENKINEKNAKNDSIYGQFQFMKGRIDLLYKQTNEHLTRKENFENHQQQGKSQRQFYSTTINNLNISNNSNKDLQLKISEIQSKNRQLLMGMTDLQQKLISSQQKLFTLIKNNQDSRLKQLKFTSDLRGITSTTNDLKKQLSIFSEFKRQLQLDISTIKSTSSRVDEKQTSHSNILLNHATLINQFNDKMKQLDHINSIQTDNIESINSQFERVINKEIIPKFTEIHQTTGEINFKLNNINNQLGLIKKSQQNKNSQKHLTTSSNSHWMQIQKNKSPNKQQLRIMIKNYFDQNVLNLMKKVKLIPSRIATNHKDKQLISTLNIFNNKHHHDHINQHNDNDIDDQTMETAYLVDEDNYLLDCQGCYLTEVMENGENKRIKLSEELIYFMTVNGVTVKQVNSRSQ